MSAPRKPGAAVSSAAEEQQARTWDRREDASSALNQARGIVDLLFVSTFSLNSSVLEELDTGSLNSILGALLDRLDEARESLDAMVRPS